MKDKDFLGSQGKLIDILEFIFLKDEPYIDLSEISDLFKLSKSGSYRILSILVKKGFLEHKKGDARYFLTKKIFDISKKLIFKEPIYFIIENILVELGNKLKEEIYFLKIENSELKIIYSNSKKNNYEFFPIHATSFGKVILSFLDNSKRKEIFNKINFEKYTIYTKDNLNEFLKEIKKIKKDGFSLSIEEFTYGICDLSFPIFDNVQDKVYSLGVRFSKTKLSELYLNEMIQVLKQTKDLLEKNLINFYKFK